MNRIDWSSIKLSERVIRIDAKIAKKRSQGIITLNETLAAWIAPFAKPNGKLIPWAESTFEKKWRQLRIDAGITENHENGLRHTFGTMHYAAFKDINLVCCEMREKNPVVLLNHYRGLASEADGKRFFALRPVGESKVVAIG